MAYLCSNLMQRSVNLGLRHLNDKFSLIGLSLKENNPTHKVFFFAAMNSRVLFVCLSVRICSLMPVYVSILSLSHCKVYFESVYKNKGATTFNKHRSSAQRFWRHPKHQPIQQLLNRLASH